MTMAEPPLTSVSEINENDRESDIDNREIENELLPDKMDMVVQDVTEEREDVDDKSNNSTQCSTINVNSVSQVLLDVIEDKCDNLKSETKPAERINFTDSDSEEELNFSSLLQRRNNRIKKDENFSLKVTSESDLLNINKVSKSKNINRIIDSDSEDENVNNVTNESTNLDHKGENDLSSEEDSNSNDIKQKKSINKSTKANNFGGLIDSESEDDRPMPNYSSKEEVTKNETGRTKKERPKKKTGAARASKDEAMRQIRSESQRLLRESEILLPYHRPKQRSLQDFLNRKKILSSLPKAPSAAAKVKMSLEIVSKAVEEKEKEVESFYKSSDSEDEITSTEPLSILSSTNINTKGNEAIYPSNTGKVDSEKVEEKIKNDNQSECNKTEFAQQSLKSLGVTRRLFSTDTNEIEIREDSLQNQKCDVEKDKSEEKENCNEVHQAFENDSEDIDISNNFIKTDFAGKVDKDNDIVLQENSENQKVRNGNHIEPVDTAMEYLKTVSEMNYVENKKNYVDDLTENDTNDFILRMSEEPFENLQTSADGVGLQENSQLENNEHLKTPLIKDNEMEDPNEKNRSDLETVVKDSRRQDILITETVGTNTNINVPGSSSNKTTGYLNDDKDNETKNSTTPIGNVYGLPPPEFDDDKSSKKLNKNMKSRILSNIANMNPKLKGSQGMIIDFSEDIKPNKTGVDNLWNRFLRHSVTNKNSENKSEVSVIHTEVTSDGLKAVKEILPYTLPIIEKNDTNLNKPGAKLLRLKAELKQKMATKRNAEWEQKEQEMKASKDNIREDDRSSSKFEDEELEEEEEEEFSDSGESEPEEDDMPIKDKPRGIKNAFIDSEAEVSDNEETGESENGENDNEFDIERELEKNNSDCDQKPEEEENEDRDERNKQSENDEDDDDDENNDNDDDGSNDKVADKSKKLKRIVRAFEEDSNDVGMKPSENDETNQRSKHTFERTRTDVDIFSEDNSNNGWASDGEVELPVFQARDQQMNDRSPICKTPLASTNYFNFISPITQLTALNTRSDSAKKDSVMKNAYSQQATECLSVQNTPIEKKSQNIYNFERRIGLQKKLFDEPLDAVNDEDLMNLCSGKFTGTENSNRKHSDLVGSSSNVKSSVSQLLNLCSGSFTTQPMDLKELEADSTQTENEKIEKSQNISLTLDEDRAISMKNSAFEKPQISEMPWIALTAVYSSDEESDSKCRNNEMIKTKRVKKRKVRKLELSDDEEESLSKVENETKDSDSDEQFVDYDSEENEIVKIPKKDIKKVATSFLEKEAELSESDWSSADEDEKDLDKLEWEEGDDDEFDEDLMRKEIEKVQMRQMLDEDQQKVTIIKEMLFEDGDLYSDGGGRQRKFKWKNIDKLGEDDKDNLRIADGEDESVDQYEEENELEWRKLRLEREKFLEEKKKEEVLLVDEIESELNDSHIFKMGIKAMKKSKSNRSDNQETPSITSESTAPIIPHSISDFLSNSTSGKKSCILKNAIQRGSFLARGEESLARIVVMVKQSKETVSLGPKHSRNFVFTYLSPSTKPDNEGDKKEEQNKEVSYNKNYKRKFTSDSTPRGSKKMKTGENRSKGKRLF